MQILCFCRMFVSRTLNQDNELIFMTLNQLIINTGDTLIRDWTHFNNEERVNYLPAVKQISGGVHARYCSITLTLKYNFEVKYSCFKFRLLCTSTPQHLREKYCT